MSIHAGHVTAAPVGEADGPSVHADFGIVCLFALFGLYLSAVSMVMGFGAGLAENLVRLG